ncbi:MAG: hypothetical protein WKF35_11880 [Ferruginibacter sp.]
MKKILIIAPHFPPSNLAAVHRSRLFAQHLPAFGWKPVILTVDEKYYEEVPDHALVKLLSPDLQVEKASAWKITRPRLVGDIGLRAFYSLYKKAKHLIKKESIDFLYIPIPSFYTALLGRWLHSSTGIRYGIDYIDPWVHTFPGSEKKFSRHWFSSRIAECLEPVAIKKASLITGVAPGYFKDALFRNPHLNKSAIHGAMPYGGEVKDHDMINSMLVSPYIFQKNKNKMQLVYAGAMLPNAYSILEAIFSAISNNKDAFTDVEFHFIGTGKSPNDNNGYNIKPLAEKYNLWETVIYEYPKRIPYLDVLMHYSIADAIFILGSTEAHYTPSKTYQAVLSGKPLYAVLHVDSTAIKVIENSKAGLVLGFHSVQGASYVEEKFLKSFLLFRNFVKIFEREQVDKKMFNEYSAYNVTGELARLLDKALVI